MISNQMHHSRKNQAGIKLIELLLVIVIGAGILFYSTRQYISYRADADVYQVQYNVDLIFQAMAEYFRANCGKEGHVLSREYPSQYFPVSLTDLENEGFFTSDLAASPLIRQVTARDGYIMQFNQVHPLPPRDITVYTNPPATPAILQTVTIGRIILWKAQVAVHLKNVNTAKQYQQLLQATCLSTSGGTSLVNPCTTGPSPPDAEYAVWERLPSFASSKMNSTYWPTMPLVKQFTQMYSTYSILLLTGNTSGTTQQYFVCGT